MAQQKRQSNLYAAEDWKQLYEAFAKINLTAYDFDTVRDSMVNYLRVTYPDSFNDWIENDEFIFILDVLAYLGQNLSFRMDMNTRENFLDTAERRASVLKLAKMISYSPKRSYPARALAKITEIKTNQDVRNSFGESLRGKTVYWNDPANDNWYENFILVLNSVFISTNQFGDPIKKNTSNGVAQHLYRMNTIPMTAPNIPFDANVNGETMKFEVVNPDFSNGGVIEERMPDPQAQKHIIYRNDGNGFDSPNTGFFVYMKQGNLTYSDFQYDQRVENRIQDVNTNNINELDVWVQEITRDGLVRTKWTKVPSMESIPYNNVNRNLKNIYSVTTRDKDQITIRFPDNRNGNVPRGTYRVWYRVSNGESYSIKTNDIQNKSVKFGYRSKSQSEYQTSTLDVKFSLQFENNSARSHETLDQIKERAPQMYYTQNRFVTGEDYNIAPLSLGNTVLKAKAINRIYSGESRYIDITDPTGKYQNTDIFSDDGSLYRDSASNSNAVLLPSTKSNSSIIVDSLQPLIGENSVIQMYQEYPRNTISVTVNQRWSPATNSTYTTNTYGQLLQTGVSDPIIYTAGTLIQFKTDSGIEQWTSVIDVLTGGYLVLSEPINSGNLVSLYIKPFRTKFNSVEVQTISRAMDKKTDFSLIYVPNDDEWVVIPGTITTAEVTYQNIQYLVLVTVTYNSDSWNFTSHGTNYVFVGGDKVRFYFVSTEKISDISTGTVQADKIDILSYNNNPINNNAYTGDSNFNILDTIAQQNGYLDGSRVVLTSSVRDSNGIPLNPTQFAGLVPTWTGTDLIKYDEWIIFHQKTDFTISSVNLSKGQFTILDSSWTYTQANVDLETITYRKNALQRNVDMHSSSINDLYNKGSGFVIGFEVDGEYFFVEQTVGNNNDRLNVLLANLTNPGEPVITPEIAFKRAIQNTGNADLDEAKKLDYYGYVDVSKDYFIKKNGRVDMNFHWKHYAPDDNRIDPSRTNLIDMYVLTSSYKDEVDLWLKNANGAEFPKPPTSTELQEIFTDVENKIVVSDSCIWHSAEYLKLFGQSAQSDYRATFKVVKLTNSTLSDDEIKQKVIQLTNEFFDISLWDFGESFFFTELSSFIHLNLSTEIATIVVVPADPNSKFGKLFEIPCEPNQLFVNTASVDNVVIVNSLAKSNINAG